MRNRDAMPDGGSAEFLTSDQVVVYFFGVETRHAGSD